MHRDKIISLIKELLALVEADKTMKPAPKSDWMARVKAYHIEHGVSMKEAMKTLKKK